jgi:hypothetical protein
MFIFLTIAYTAWMYRKGLLGLKEVRDGTLGRGRRLSRTWSNSRTKRRRKGCGSGSMEMSNLMKRSKLQLAGNLEAVGRGQKSVGTTIRSAIKFWAPQVGVSAGSYIDENILEWGYLIYSDRTELSEEKLSWF